jgi:hypothetical protein
MPVSITDDLPESSWIIQPILRHALLLCEDLLGPPKLVARAYRKILNQCSHRRQLNSSRFLQLL